MAVSQEATREVRKHSDAGVSSLRKGVMVVREAVKPPSTNEPQRRIRSRDRHGLGVTSLVCYRTQQKEADRGGNSPLPLESAMHVGNSRCS